MKISDRIHGNQHEGLRLLFINIFFVILLSAAFILPQNVFAEPDWQVKLTVAAGTAYNNLVLGTDSTATNGYDPQWDTYALMGGTVEAYFPHTDWGVPHQQFHRDIRAHAPGSAIEWSITVSSSLTNENFTISWDLSSIPDANPIILIDDSLGQQTDMRTSGSYSFTYTAVRNLRVQVTENTTCSNLPARISRTVPAYYSSLQDAYNSAADGEIIESLAETLTGDLDINLSKSVTLDGGYNCSYSSNPGKTILNGTLTISSGSLSIRNISVQ